MRPLPGPLLAALLFCLPLVAVADPVGYAAGYDTLYRIDLGTGQAVRVGPIGYTDVEGLAFSPTGVLYGVADGTASSGGAASDFLIRIDTNTGAGTLVAPLLGLNQQGTPGAGDSLQLDYGLAFTADGRLWVSSDTINLLWEVNPSTGFTRLVGNTGARISGLAARGNELFGVSTAGDEALYRIDTTTGQGTRIGSLGLADRMYDAGLDFDASGKLWVTVDYFSPPTGLPPLRNDVARLDPNTGAILEIRTITGAGTGINSAEMEGLAIAPPPGSGSGVLPPVAREIPGPGAPALSLLALLAIGLGWRRLAV